MSLTLAYAWTAMSEVFPKEVRFALILVPLAVSVAVWSPLATIVQRTYSL